MQPLSEQERTDNFRPDRTCAVCQDDAQVVVGTHVHCGAVYEDMGPCPFCLRGLRLEKGLADRWGPDGYWKGRELPQDLVDLWERGSLPAMSHSQQVQALQDLVRLPSVDEQIVSKQTSFMPVPE